MNRVCLSGLVAERRAFDLKDGGTIIRFRLVRPSKREGLPDPQIPCVMFSRVVARYGDLVCDNNVVLVDAEFGGDQKGRPELLVWEVELLEGDIAAPATVPAATAPPCPSPAPRPTLTPRTNDQLAVTARRRVDERRSGGLVLPTAPPPGDDGVPF